MCACEQHDNGTAARRRKDFVRKKRREARGLDPDGPAPPRTPRYLPAPALPLLVFMLRLHRTEGGSYGMPQVNRMTTR